MGPTNFAAPEFQPSTRKAKENIATYNAHEPGM
jgi:hypothetical protein